MKPILVAFFFTLAASQHQRNYLSNGSYTYTDDDGKTVQITYVEDNNGIHITSHNFPPEEEKKIIERIKQHRIQLQDQLNRQLSQMNEQLNQQLSQMNERLNQQFGQYGKQYAFQVRPFRPVVLTSASPKYNTFPCAILIPTLILQVFFLM